MRQVFETNFWGVVYGSLVAAKNLKPSGGAIINVGSTLSDRAIPLQGIYCASKHAVKGFTDALRMELEADGAPISVTLDQTERDRHAIQRSREELSRGPARESATGLRTGNGRGSDPSLRRKPGA